MKFNMNTGKKPFIHQHSLCFRHNYVAAHCCSNTEEDNEKKNIDVLLTHSICTKLPAMNESMSKPPHSAVPFIETPGMTNK